MSELFITSDTHFGHANILRFCSRPFFNIKEHDQALIDNWNSVVGPNDTVYHLGDVAFKCSMDYALNIMKKLNGTKHLILGNHDKLAKQFNNIRPNTWESVEYYAEIEHEKQYICLFHYPQATWHWAYKNAWQLYGHVHGNMKNSGKSLDVGVDCWKYTPVSFEQLKNIMDKVNVHEIIKNKWNKSDITPETE
jgi:calcineurin-like phosphoesterase family protein